MTRTKTGTTGTVKWTDYYNIVYSLNLPGSDFESDVIKTNQRYFMNQPSFRLTVKRRETPLFDYKSKTIAPKYRVYGTYLVEALASQNFLTLEEPMQFEVLTILFEGTWFS